MKKRTKLAIVTGSVAAVGAAVYVGTNTLTNLAAKRNSPLFDRLNTFHLQKKLPDPNEPSLRDAREWLLEQPFEDVEIQSYDALRLKGHMLTCETARRTVLLFHGWREEWTSNLGSIARFLHAHETNVILIEQRAQGESEGSYIGFGVLERFDCKAWADYAASVFPELPIYLGGISMGATTVLMASSLDLPDAVHGIIADCGFTSPKAILTHILGKRLHLPAHPTIPLMNLMLNYKAGYRCDDFETQQALKDTKLSVLFFHGDCDTFVPLAMTLENYLACSSKKELVIVEGAGHGESYLRDPATYEAALLRFFSDHDEK